MPIKLERIWTDQEHELIGGTIIALRRARSAAIAGLQRRTPDTWIPRLIHQERFQAPKDRQAILTDAENLANKGGRYIARRLAQNVQGITQAREWKEMLDDMSSKYGRFPTSVTFAKTSQLEVAGYFFSHARALKADPNHVLNWDLAELNNLGGRDAKSVTQRAHSVIVAPLSGDLFTAAIDVAYLMLNNRGHLDLRATASTKDLRTFVLPDLTPELDRGVEEVGVFFRCDGKRKNWQGTC